MSIGERIRQQRKALGITQNQLADLVGVSRAAVSLWERSDPSLQNEPRRNHRSKLAEVLDTTEDWLLTGRNSSVHPSRVVSLTNTQHAVVQGIVGLGVWIEDGANLMDLPKYLPSYPTQRHSDAPQFVFRLDGDDLSASYPGAKFIYVVSITATGHSIAPGDVVLLEHRRDQSKENSCWRIRKLGEELFLESDSRSQKGQHTVTLKEIEDDPNRSIEWLAVGFAGDL